MSHEPTLVCQSLWGSQQTSQMAPPPGCQMFSKMAPNPHDQIPEIWCFPMAKTFGCPYRNYTGDIWQSTVNCRIHFSKVWNVQKYIFLFQKTMSKIQLCIWSFKGNSSFALLAVSSYVNVVLPHGCHQTLHTMCGFSSVLLVLQSPKWQR